jgi:site-specific DNA recombinase
MNPPIWQALSKARRIALVTIERLSTLWTSGRLTYSGRLAYNGFRSVVKQRKGEPMKAAIGYVRVSTGTQAVDGISLDGQREKIAAWCKANDVELQGVFCDAGLSGKRADNRPELQAALDAVCKVHGILIVYSLSRLARSTKDTIIIGERLQKTHCDLVSLSERIDTTSAAGRMVFRLLAVFAEFERDLASERTTMGLAWKKSQGERTGRVPFGFSLGDDGIHLIPNADEQTALALIHSLREQGESLRDIAAELTNRGIPTKSGNHVWDHTAIRRILKRAA